MNEILLQEAFQQKPLCAESDGFYYFPQFAPSFVLFDDGFPSDPLSVWRFQPRRILESRSRCDRLTVRVVYMQSRLVWFDYFCNGLIKPRDRKAEVVANQALRIFGRH